MIGIAMTYLDGFLAYLDLALFNLIFLHEIGIHDSTTGCQGMLHLFFDKNIKFDWSEFENGSSRVRPVGALGNKYITVTYAWIMVPISEGSQMKELPLNSGTSLSSPFFMRDHLYTHGTVLSSSLLA